MIVTTNDLLNEDGSKWIDLFDIRHQLLEGKKKNPFLEVICNLEEDKIVGYLFYSKIYERIEIDQIEVDSAYRQRGIASKLLHQLIQLAKEENLTNITLEVRKDNVAALALYEKFQFKKVAIREKYYQGIDGVLMELEVKG